MNHFTKTLKGAIATLFLLITLTVAGQTNNTQKTDKIIFLDGTTKEGKVTGLTTDKIQFTHRSETLSYEFKKADIEKIEYASGRVEVITEKKLPEAPVVINSRNKVAIVPLQYIGDVDESRSEDMGVYLQDIAINYLSKSAAELKFMDAVEINALLRKKGIDDSNIRQYTPAELAEFLHVEYVIMGSVLQDKGSVITTVNNTNTKKQTVDTWKYDTRVVKKNSSHGSAVTRQDIETQVTFSIYNKTGEKIYSKSRHSLLSEQDAYKNTIQYLLKRTPLYKR
jgi:hypothetical protein